MLRAAATLLLLSPGHSLAADEIFDIDDGLSLLQARAQSVLADGGPRHYVPASHGSLRYVGRHDVVQFHGSSVVRFDAAGFEIQFRVQGTTEVKIAMEQRITGPAGWYFEPVQMEMQYADGCHVDNATKVVSLQQTRHTTGPAINSFTGVAMENKGSQPHHFLVYINGVALRKPLPGSRCHVCTFDTVGAKSGQVAEYLVASTLDPSKVYDIRIVKSSEPDLTSADGPVPNWLALHGVLLDKGIVLPPKHERRTRKIEFMGDSMMSGYCNGCKGGLCTAGKHIGSWEMGAPTDGFRWGSFANAWPRLLCEYFDAECHATVMSGMGMRCNTHPPGMLDCSKDVTLPDYWERTLATDDVAAWDFSQWIPDVMLVQVSNNDHMMEDPKSLVPPTLETYKGFFDTAKKRYPDTHFVLVCGPLPSHDISDFLCPKFEEFAKKEELGFMLVMDETVPYQKGDSNFRTCCGHPDENYHQWIMAKAANLVRETTGW